MQENKLGSKGIKNDGERLNGFADNIVVITDKIQGAQPKLEMQQDRLKINITITQFRKNLFWPTHSFGLFTSIYSKVLADLIVTSGYQAIIDLSIQSYRPLSLKQGDIFKMISYFDKIT